MTSPHRLESAIQRDIEIALGAEPDLLLLRNSVGLARYANERTGQQYSVPYGLGVGSPDLVGILNGRWFTLEIKQPGEEAEPHQEKVHEVWRRFGAFVETVTSVEEAKAALERARLLSKGPMATLVAPTAPVTGDPLTWLPTADTSLLAASLAYAEHGFRVIPVWNLVTTGQEPACACDSPSCDKPGKHPIGSTWQKRATSDPDAVRDARRKHPDANVGLVMGGPERYIAVDIDGEAGRSSWAALEEKHGPAPVTLTSKSGRPDGGGHRIYYVPEHLDIRRIKNRSATNGLKGIDTRGPNGQIVAAPSIHYTGNRYAWDIQAPVATIPDWLFEAVAAEVERPSRPPPAGGTVIRMASAYVRKVIENTARDVSARPKGERNSVLFAKASTAFEYCIGEGMPEREAWQALYAAGLSCGLLKSEVLTILNNAWKAALDSPRRVPERVPASSNGRTACASVAPPRPMAHDADGVVQDSVSTAEAASGTHRAAPVALTREPDVATPDELDDLVWQSDLRRNGKGEIETTLANVTTILAMHPVWRGVVVYDAFGECVVATRPPPVRPQDRPAAVLVTAREWSDEDSIRTVNWLDAEFALEVSTTTVDQAVSAVAQRHIAHPVRDYLAELTWDGVPRIDGLLAEYFGADDSAYTRGVGSRWMISAVARVFQPGCQADCTLVLESPQQGVGKSTGLEALAGKAWFADTGITVGDKDSYQSLRRKWIYELGELAATKGRDVERVKNFLSARSDNYRPSYGRRNRDFLRQCVFAGTTNESHYLADRTGNRRFWPVRVSQVNVEAIRRDRDQLWAEATARFHAGEPWHVNTPEFRSLCIEEQSKRVQNDPWEPIVAAWLTNPWVTLADPTDGRVKTERVDLTKGVTTSEVLLGAIKMRAGDIARTDEMRAADVLKAVGWTDVRQVRENRSRMRRYFKGCDEVVPEVVPGKVIDTSLISSVSQLEQPQTVFSVQTINGGEENVHAGARTHARTSVCARVETAFEVVPVVPPPEGSFSDAASHDSGFADWLDDEGIESENND